MAANIDEVIALLANVNQAIEKASSLKLATAVYLLDMARLELEIIVYGQGSGTAKIDHVPR